MAEPFIGEIIMFGGNFAPRGWALCDGQLLAINSNQALFSILGTTYGGDGRTTFALPDLRGRVSMHVGNGAGLTPRRLGERGGTETHTLTTNQIPAHSHPVSVPTTSAMADDTQPNRNALGQTRADVYSQSATDGELAGVTAGNTGGGQSVNHVQPFTGVNYIIALVGVFPARN